MKVSLLYALSSIFGASLFSQSPASRQQSASKPDFLSEKITVYRDGLNCFIKSSYSREQDIVIRIFNYANECSWLVPKGSDIRKCSEHFLLHRNGDEYPATLLKGYNALGGNHGSIFLKMVGAPCHGFTSNDAGTALRDGKGNIWRLVEVFPMPLGDDLLIHPENRGTDGKPDFPDRVGKILYRPDGSPLKLFYEQTVQMHPMNRITVFEYLIDGRVPLPDRQVIECSFLEHHFVHDVLSPGAVVRWLAENFGRKGTDIFSREGGMMFAERAPEGYRQIPALFTVENRYRYQIRGAQVLERTTTWHSAGLSGKQLEQMFGWYGGIVPKDDNGKYYADAVEEMYIPKLKKIQLADIDRPEKTEIYDFSRIAAMPRVMNVNYTITTADCSDPADPPDRFIRMTGRGKRQYGIAVGYSLFDGCTAKGRQETERTDLYHLYKTKKLYPFAYQVNDVAAGTKIRSVSYKQYFDPNADPDIPVMYLHQEKNSWVLYMDFFKKMQHKTVKLPDFLVGYNITILEKTSSVIPAFSHIAGKEGISFQVHDDYGYLVVKFDKPQGK